MVQLETRNAWEMQSVLIQEARDEPQLWRPSFPFDTFDRIIASAQRLSQYLVRSAAVLACLIDSLFVAAWGLTERPRSR
jgi:hypothetical protein